MMHSYVGEDRGVFGPVSDLFGFDDLSQAALDPFAAANAPLVERATRYLKSYDHLHSLIKSLPSQSQRDEAMSIVNSKWHGGILGIGARYTLPELAAQVRSYLAERPPQFVRLSSDFSISRSRADRLESFVRGVKALQKYMKQYLVLPTEVTVTEVDKTPEALLGQARAAAAKARKSRSPVDIAVAKGLAEAAYEAGKTVDSPAAGEAYALMQEMDSIAAVSVAPTAGKTQTDTTAGPDLNTIILVGGGALVVIGGILLLTRK